jgi:hypothetical protein
MMNNPTKYELSVPLTRGFVLGIGKDKIQEKPIAIPKLTSKGSDQLQLKIIIFWQFKIPAIQGCRGCQPVGMAEH